ncbi:substrate-binding periplasmic protein [Vibrio marisflavi]|nr:transporter substrate-binding domain-containing protein [Vibrio marisflavi]
MLLLVFCSNAYSQINVIVYGDDSYPPYSYTENGKISGVYTEILKRVFAKMPEYNVEIHSIPWKRGLAKIENGEIFALYPPYKRSKQRPFMEYDGPILNEKLVVVCLKPVLETPRPNWPLDYIGLKIGGNSGFSSGGDQFYDLVEKNQIELDEVKGTESNILKLISGRIDCYMNDAISIQWELNKLQLSGQYDGESIVQGAVISSEHGYLGIASDGREFSFKEDFKQQYLGVLKAMKKSGEIEKIISKFLK